MPSTHSPSPELLAPAGDWEALRAAVANGANAVYFGLDQFNARHRAHNFTLAELPEVRDLHRHNVKGFVTFNTLIFSDELPAAADYLTAIANAGADAIIVQDLGLALLASRLCPSLHLHASTQMTLTEPRGIEFVRRLGIQRTVLARELSLTDIQQITAATDMPLEVFVHGALCVSYSGQCLTSESIGGRSANRGQCAQACRLPYQLLVDGRPKDLGDKAYLLSPSDLAAYDLIADLTKLGVASFKIEGRLKSPHYVAATTQTYRAAIDATRTGTPFQISAPQKHNLEQTFSRGFTHGFLSGVNHQQLVSARFPKARGTLIGKVLAKSGHAVTIQLEHQKSKIENLLKPGDGVVFDEGHPEQDEQGGRIYAVKPAGAPGHTATDALELQFHEHDVNLSAINPGTLVWKTDDPALKRRLEHSYSRDAVPNRIPLHFNIVARTGERLKITATDDAGHRAEASWNPLEKAQKFPATEPLLREQLTRLGDTPFTLGTLTVDLAGDPMIPKSILNQLRRDLADQIQKQREHSHKIADPNALQNLRAQIENQKSKIETPSLHILARTMDQLHALLSADLRPASLYVEFEDVRRYPEAVRLCREARIPVALATLRIVKPTEHGFLKQIAECAPDAILVRSLAALAFYHETAPHIPLIGDYSLNIANELTAHLFAGEGLTRMVPSYDLNWPQLSALLARADVSKIECVIHQHMPMFHMEHCVFAHTLSNGADFRTCGRPCERHQLDLADRAGENHPLLPDVGCRNTLFNAQAQSAAQFIPQMLTAGVKHFRIELLRESPDLAKELFTRYTRLLSGEEPPQKTLRSLRVINHIGITPGTLVHE